MSGLDAVYEPAALAACGGLMGEGLAPLPPLPMPQYRESAGGRWRLVTRTLVAAPGYFRGPQPLSAPAAILTRGRDTWMSTTPGEIESQMPHAAVSSGKVVICGLGMGVMAYAVSARRAVDKVVVVERDREVVSMFRDFSDFESWPQRAKLEIEIADACEYRCNDADFLYVDIWPRYRMPEAIRDMKTIYSHCPATACGYWGQELDMVAWAEARGKSLEAFSEEDVQAYASAHGLPLIGPEIVGYARLCRMAAATRALGRPQ